MPSAESNGFNIAATLLGLACSGVVFAQDIEPRRWTPLPVGTNIAGAGYVYTDGEISVDPVFKLDDTTVEVSSTVVSFLHAFDLMGRSARFDVRSSHHQARWKGLLDGEPRKVGRTGLGDPRVRLSINLLGAPAFTEPEYRAFRASCPVSTVVGVALAVTLPLGEYKKDKLLNLGQNRFVLRPQLGVVHSRGPWSYELTGSVFLFTDNDEFRTDRRREQDPLFALQSHIIYTSTSRWWASLSAAYDWKGASRVDGVRQDDTKRDLLYGISAGFTVTSNSSIKRAYVGSRTRRDIGADADNFGLAYSVRF